MPKYPLIRDILGDLRATFFVWEMLVLDRRVFASEGGSRHRGFTIVLNQGKGRGVRRSCLDCTVLLSQADGPLAVTDLTAGVFVQS